MSDPIDSHRALVGTWREEPHPVYSTPVAFTIALEDGRFHIRGIDESDGVALETLDTNWDGATLYFVTYCAPTKHRAIHEFRIIGANRVECVVSYVDEEGEHRELQYWHRALVN